MLAGLEKPLYDCFVNDDTMNTANVMSHWPRSIACILQDSSILSEPDGVCGLRRVADRS